MIYSPADSKFVLVVSHFWVGHIPGYHTVCVNTLLALGATVASVVPHYAEYKSVESVYRFPYRNKPPSQVIKKSANTLSRLILGAIDRKMGVYEAICARAHWRNLGLLVNQVEAERESKIDLVFVVYLGLGFLVPGVGKHFVEKSLTSRWAGIWNGPSPGRFCQNSILGFILPPESALRAKNSIALWVPHPGLIKRVTDSRVTARVRAMPEIADLTPPPETSTLGDKIRGKAAGKKIVALLGSISVRKGVYDIVHIARLALTQAPTVFFLVAGEFTDVSAGTDYRGIEQALETAPPNLLFIPGRLSDGAEFNTLVALSDVIYAVYRNFAFQSNLLTKAAAFNKPALVARGGVMEESVREFCLGEAVPVGDYETCLLAIINLIELKDLHARKIVPRFNEFSAANDAALLEPLFIECI